MYLEKELVDSLPIDYHQMVRPGYLGQLKRVLQTKHAHLLERASSEPEFLLGNETRFEKVGAGEL